MSDVKALIARLRKYLQAREEVTPQIAGQVFDTVVDLDMGSRGHIRLLASDIAQVADALEAAQQAPAVDREALENALGVALANAYDDDSVVTVEESVAGQLLASGILQDAAEVEARGLDTVAAIIENPRPGKGDTLKRADVVAALRNRADQRREGLPLDPEFRAQQVREGNA